HSNDGCNNRVDDIVVERTSGTPAILFDDDFESYTAGVVLPGPWSGGGFADQEVTEFAEAAADGMGQLLSSGVQGSGNATFRFNHPNGRILTSLAFSGVTGSDYSVDVQVNGSMPVSAVVSSNRMGSVYIPAVVTNGVVDVSIEGSGWMLSAVIPNLVMGIEEDYQYDRYWWVSGQEPWKLEQFNNKASWSTWPDGSFSDAVWDY
ncbi:MAG: hypothetical protein ABFR33_11485, partial [Verrucomicrobiota bacterium]